MKSDQEQIDYFNELMNKHWDFMAQEMYGLANDLHSRIYRELFRSDIRQCMVCRQFVSKDHVSVQIPYSVCLECDKSVKPNQVFLSQALDNDLYTIPPPVALRM
jgi:hypothetical protein